MLQGTRILGYLVLSVGLALLLPAGSGAWDPSQPPLGERLQLLRDDEVVVLFDYEPDDIYLYEPEDGTDIPHYLHESGQGISRRALDVAAGNLDDDPYDEIVVLEEKAGYPYGGAEYYDGVRILDTSDGVNWTWYGPYSVNVYDAKEVACGDVDGDGLDEIIVLDDGGGTGEGHRDSLWWFQWAGPAGGGILPEFFPVQEGQPETNTSGEFWDYIGDIDCGDLDADGYDEIVGLDTDGRDKLRIYDYNDANSDGSHKFPGFVTSHRRQFDLAVGDFDPGRPGEEVATLDRGDGKDKLFFYGLSYDGQDYGGEQIYGGRVNFDHMKSIAAGGIGEVEQVVFALDDQGDDLDVIRTFELRKDGGSFYIVTLRSFTAMNSLGFDVAAGDFDADSPRLEFLGGPYDTSEPNRVFAVLYAPPYEEGISGGTFSSTIGKDYTEAMEYSHTISVRAFCTLGVSRGVGVEAEAGPVSAAASVKEKFSVTLEAALERTVGRERSVTIGDKYTGSVDNVVVGTIKYWTYVYKVVDPDSLSGIEGECITIRVPKPNEYYEHAPLEVWSLEDYNDMCRAEGRPTIPSAHIVGDVSSYPRKLQLADGSDLPSESLVFDPGKLSPFTPGSGQGEVTRSVSLDTVEINSEALSAGVTGIYGYEVEVEAGAEFGGGRVKVMGGASYEVGLGIGTTSTFTTSVGTSTVFESNAGYIPSDLYDKYGYSYRMFVYKHPDGYYVVDYYLTDLSQGHFLPEVLSPNGGEVLKGTAEVRWRKPAEYKRTAEGLEDDELRYYEIFVSSGGSYQYLDRVYAGSDSSEVSYAWDTTRFPDGRNYKLKVVAHYADGDTTVDESDSTFSVDNEPPGGELTVPDAVTLDEDAYITNSSGSHKRVVYIDERAIMRAMKISAEGLRRLMALGEDLNLPVTLHAYDAGSWVKNVEFKEIYQRDAGWDTTLAGTFSFSSEDTTFTVTLPISSHDGTKRITAELEDGSGNRSSVEVVVVQDTKAPEVGSFKVVDEDGDKYTKDTSVRLVLAGIVEEGSGLDSLYVTVDGSSQGKSFADLSQYRDPSSDSWYIPWNFQGPEGEILVPEGNITVKVKVSDRLGHRSSLMFDQVVYDSTSPPPPSSLMAKPGTNEVVLSWEGSSDAESGILGYNVYRSNSLPVETVDANRLNSTPLDTTRYEDEAVLHDTTYYYCVTALDRAGNESSPSNTASVLLTEREINAMHGQAPDVDGILSQGEWDGADRTRFLLGSSYVYVYAREDGDSLYLAFKVPDASQNSDDYVAVLFDVDLDTTDKPDSDDLWLQVNRSRNLEARGTGTGWGNFVQPEGWSGAASSGPSGWSAELEVSCSKLGIVPWRGKKLGVSFLVYDSGSNSSCVWPSGADRDNPRTWGALYSSDGWRGDLLTIVRSQLPQQRYAYRGGEVTVLPLDLSVDANTCSLLSMTFLLTGKAEDSDVEVAKLYDDPNADGVGDFLLAQGSFSSGKLSFRLGYEVSRGSQRHLLLTYQISEDAEWGRTLGAELSEASVASPDSVRHSSSIASSPLFRIDLFQARELSLGWGTSDVSAGDLDGIGMADLAVVHDDSVTVYLNPWTLSVSIPVSGSRVLALGDMDQDGNLDVVVGSDDSVEVLLGPFKSDWQDRRWKVFTGFPARSLKVGDLNMDGLPDVVVGGEEMGMVLWNIRDGLEVGQALEQGLTADLALGDVDGDGDLDLLEAAVGVGDRLYLNDGEGNLILSSTFGSASVDEVELSDVDGDGDLDLLELRRFVGSGLAVYRNSGGKFEPEELKLTASKGSDFLDHLSLSIGDLDNDGDGDLVIGKGTKEGLLKRHQEDFRVLVCANVGGTFEPRLWYMEYGINALTLADLNSDGDLDLVAGTELGSWLYINMESDINHNPNAPPSAPSPLEVCQDWRGVRFSWSPAEDELTPSDALTYIFKLTEVPSGKLVVSGRSPVGPGDVGPAPFRFLARLPGGIYKWQVRAVDGGFGRSDWSEPSKIEVYNTLEAYALDKAPAFALPGDEVHMMDLVLRARSGSAEVRSVTLRLTGTASDGDVLEAKLVRDSNGNGTYEPEADTAGWKGTPKDSEVLFGDMGLSVSEGRPETLLVVVELSDSSRAGVTLGAEVTGISVSEPNFLDPTGIPFSSGLTSVAQFAVRDTVPEEGDVKKLALADLDGDGGLDLICGTSRGISVHMREGEFDFGRGSVEALTLGDLDSDGDLDLVVGYGGAPVRMYLNDGSGGFAASGALTTSDASALALGDVDLDGDLDMVVGRGQGRPNVLYLNDGDGNFTDSGSSLGAFGTTCLSLGDLDGDGDLDLIEGTWGQGVKLYYNLGGFPSVPDTTLGSAYNMSLGLVDLDEDGDLDIVVGNLDNVVAFRNDGHGTFSATEIAPKGASSLARGDMDNDGDFDLVVADRTTTSFLRNEGSGDFVPAQLLKGAGLGTCVGDVDGDGDLDIVSGGRGAGLTFLNLLPASMANDPPGPPRKPTCSVVGHRIVIRWKEADDAESPSEVLGYNLRVGTSPGMWDVMSGAAGAWDEGRATFRYLQGLPGGRYYFSLRTVDPGFARSAWTKVDSFSAPHVLSVRCASRAPAGAKQGARDVPMLEVMLSAGSGSVRVTGIAVRRTGGAKIDSVRLCWDVDSSGTFEVGVDSVIGVQPFVRPKATFKGLDLEVSSGHPEHLLVLFDVARDAQVRDTFGAELGEIEVGPGCAVAPFGPVRSELSTVLDASLVETPPTIVHVPLKVASANRPLTVSAVVTDNTRVDQVFLYYRPLGDTAYVELTMVPEDSLYSADVPAAALTQPGLEYYIFATDGSNWTTVPPEGPDSPYRVKIVVPGDFDGNGRVDFEDFFAFVENFGLSSGDPGFEPIFDLDGDGTVDFEDFFIFVENFGLGVAKKAPMPASAGRNMDASVSLKLMEKGTDEFEVEVRLEGATELKGYGMAILYDPDASAFLRAEPGGLLHREGVPLFLEVSDRPERGRIWLAHALPGRQYVTGSGTLAKLSFRSKKGQPMLRVEELELLDASFGRNFIRSLPGLNFGYWLSEARPNPFNASMSISYRLPRTSHVRIAVYNILGQPVRVLAEGVMETGIYKALWDGRDEGGSELASGVYLVRMEAGGFSKVRKVVLVR